MPSSINTVCRLEFIIVPHLFYRNPFVFFFTAYPAGIDNNNDGMKETKTLSNYQRVMNILQGDLTNHSTFHRVKSVEIRARKKHRIWTHFRQCLYLLLFLYVQISIRSNRFQMFFKLRVPKNFKHSQESTCVGASF